MELLQKLKYENEVVGAAARRGPRSRRDLFGNESHGLRLPAAIFCRALPYRYGCIFKGCHVKRQARPLNTFKFINGEGYTPAIYSIIRRAAQETRTHAGAQCCPRYAAPEDLIRAMRTTFRVVHTVPTCTQFAVKS